jgi:DNA polymerase (family 10)
MPRTNDDVEQVLLEFADLLAILSDDPFKPRAYEKAAKAVGGYPADLAGMDLKQVLQIPGVGKSIGEKIHAYLTTGSIPELEALRDQIPGGVREMMSVPGLGPKKAMTLYDELGIDSVDALAAAVEEDRIASLKGFGEKTQTNIARGIQQLSASSGRVKVSVALDVAERLLGELRALPGVRRADYDGSLRRMAETIGDVDLLVAAGDANPVMEAFTRLPLVARVLARG